MLNAINQLCFILTILIPIMQKLIVYPQHGFGLFEFQTEV